ncbi:MAG: class I SAM-dependent methyltransferase [Proteobacteria bacterium]|nr:class I SAM-dependent methyltransferase [Pseudomonadota bacterium]
MNIEVNPEWWKELFDEVYLVTDARSVCDEDVTRREIDLLRELIPLSPEHEILDLCGGHGRHSMELHSRGFKKCTVLDYSQFLIDRGRREAGRLGMEITFLQGDARATGLPPESFDHVLILGNSLGYIASPEGDRAILSEAMRLVKRGGRLLIDIVNGATLRSRFNPLAWHEIGDDIVVCRNRSLDGDMVYAREMVISKKSGLIRDNCYSLRIYEPDSMRRLLAQIGFSGVTVLGDFSPFHKIGDYGFMNSRMIVTAQKP